jgi:hypothetical protein
MIQQQEEQQQQQKQQSGYKSRASTTCSRLKTFLIIAENLISVIDQIGYLILIIIKSKTKTKIQF